MQALCQCRKTSRGAGDENKQFLPFFKKMVRPERFELPTTWFVARYSIQLSYGRIVRRLYSTEGREKTRRNNRLIYFSLYGGKGLPPVPNSLNGHHMPTILHKEHGGERGIRTLDTLLAYTPLAGVRLRPLGHLSGRGTPEGYPLVRVT